MMDYERLVHFEICSGDGFKYRVQYSPEDPDSILFEYLEWEDPNWVAKDEHRFDPSVVPLLIEILKDAMDERQKYLDRVVRASESRGSKGDCNQRD